MRGGGRLREYEAPAREWREVHTDMLWASRIMRDSEKKQQRYFLWGGKKERDFTVREVCLRWGRTGKQGRFWLAEKWREKREKERGLSLIPPRRPTPRSGAKNRRNNVSENDSQSTTTRSYYALTLCDVGSSRHRQTRHSARRR